MKESKKNVLKEIIFWKYNPDDKNNFKYGIYSTLFWGLIMSILFLVVASFIGV